MFLQNDIENFRRGEVNSQEIHWFFAIKTRVESSHSFLECQVAATRKKVGFSPISSQKIKIVIEKQSHRGSDRTDPTLEGKQT